MTILVEGFDPDATALARFLAREGYTLRLASPAAKPPDDAAELRELGIRIEARANLDADPGPADLAYLDVWTPAVAPRVHRLRAQGTRISCLGDLLLERWRGPTIGITGTAGKTTTTSLVAAILRQAGVDVAVSRGARAGNLWPTADLLEHLPVADARAPRPRAPQTLLLELTSSHLAFMRTSPTIAAVTSFWPDHLELHGDLAAYRAAKETIVRHQHEGDTVVVNADDEAAAFAASALTPAQTIEFSLVHKVERGAYLDTARHAVLVDAAGERDLGPLPDQPHPANALAAAAIAAAAGATDDAIQATLHTTSPLPWRAQPQGTLAGIPVVDDGMAATPRKTAALLENYPNASIVLIAGGLADAGGGPVHAAPEEQALLEQACDEIARAARLVVLFGPGGARLAPLLHRRNTATASAADIAHAVELAAASQARQGATAIVFSPMFPLSLRERAWLEQLLHLREPEENPPTGQVRA